MCYFRLQDLEEKELIPGFRVRFVHSKTMTLAFWNIDAGATLPKHSHPHEQVCNVLEGTLELTVEGNARELGSGSVVVIPSDADHSGKAVTNCRVLDVFHPVRQDYQ